jgi:hypothetical protein
MPVVLGSRCYQITLLLPGVTNARKSFWLQRSWCWSKSDSVRWPIFNSSHVFGFSPFLTLIYKGFKLYKGGILLILRSRFFCFGHLPNGEQQRIPHEWRIGLISSRLLEGPLVKDKGSFRGRSSYGHLFLNFLKSKKIILSILWFECQLSYKLDPNNNLFLSGYFGRDVFSLNKSFTNIYGNSILNLRWNHLSQINYFQISLFTVTTMGWI